MNITSNARILVVDIETAPMLAYLWGLYDQTVGVNQIHAHSYLLSASAKWAHSGEMLYLDQRNETNIENDLALTKWLWELLDQADVVVGQNSKRFDVRTINARIEYHNLKRYSDFRQQDTKIMAKRSLNLPSYSLAYMGEFFQLKNRKLDHKKFAGFDLWKATMNKNMEAFNEMQVYNEADVRATEELWLRLLKWDDTIKYSVFDENDAMPKCDCGCIDLRKNGFRRTNAGNFQRYSCFDCGKPVIDRRNLLPALKKSELLK